MSAPPTDQPTRLRIALPPYPIGWFAIATSEDLAAGTVRAVQAFGRELVVFRTAGGAVHLLDAYCPHLGAHLGHGGVVDGERLQCPFHGWRFDGTGACVDIPYANKIPKAARTTSWPMVERNGMLMAWHHPTGAAPSYEVPEYSELTSAAWTKPRTLFWRIRTHVQDVMENVVDSAHLPWVHLMPRMPEVVGVEAAGAEFRFKLAAQSVDFNMTLLGLGIQLGRNRTDLGMGANDFQHTTFVTPIDGEFVEMRNVLSVRRVADEALTARMEQAWEELFAAGVRQDIAVWTHKRYLAAPVLVDGEGPIGLYRRWVRAFYSDESRDG